MKFLVFSLILSLPTLLMARDFQTINPALDQAFISELGMFQIGSALPERFNILIIGQDNSLNHKKRDERYLLGSRADIMMVLSISTVDASSTILSIYRDNDPGSGCQDKIGKTPASAMINGVYSVGGRKEFIPCLEGMIEARIRNNENFAGLLDQNGEFKVHAFFEGTRSDTISPVARASVDVVMDNKWTFTSIYGMSAMGAAINLISSGDQLQTALDSTMTPEQEEAVRKASDYLLIELKERHIYQAGGFQRALNFATVISTVLGWSAYGINQSSGDNYNFLGKFFGDIITKNFSASHDFNALEKDVFMRNGKHLLVNTCYSQDVSPIRVIQWGDTTNSYAIYENGQLDLSHAKGMLRLLKIVSIIPTPPSCN